MGGWVGGREGCAREATPRLTRRYDIYLSVFVVGLHIRCVRLCVCVGRAGATRECAHVRVRVRVHVRVRVRVCTHLGRRGARR